jgi:hypothetical protein
MSYHHRVREGLGCFLFLNSQGEVGSSISSSVVLCSFVLLAYIVVFVLVLYLCPSSVRVVTIFAGTILFPLLCSVLQFFPLIHWFFPISNFVIPSKCLKVSSVLFLNVVSLFLQFPNFTTKFQTTVFMILKLQSLVKQITSINISKIKRKYSTAILLISLASTAFSLVMSTLLLFHCILHL